MARALAVVALMAAVFGMASAATYNVGEPSGSWDLRTNYADWVASKRFHPGDQIGKHCHQQAFLKKKKTLLLVVINWLINHHSDGNVQCSSTRLRPTTCWR